MQSAVFRRARCRSIRLSRGIDRIHAVEAIGLSYVGCNVARNEWTRATTPSGGRQEYRSGCLSTLSKPRGIAALPVASNDAPPIQVIRNNLRRWTDSGKARDSLVELFGGCHFALLGEASHGTHARRQDCPAHEERFVSFYSSVVDFSGKDRFEDDLTVVVLKAVSNTSD